jgi:HK97 family phage major capsid protein
MLILKDILPKDPASLNEEEKTFLKVNADQLNDADKKKFADIISEALDISAVRELISQNAKDILAKKADEFSNELVSKFMAGVDEQRKKALDTGKPADGKDEKKDAVTRKFMKCLFNGDTAGAKALTTSDSGSAPDDAQAGLLIPEELMAEVLRIAEKQYGLARREMRYLPFSGPGNSRKIPALGTSVNVFWIGETVKKQSTQPKFNIVEQTLKKLAAIVPMSEEILEDSLINLTQLIGDLFAEAVAKEEDLQFFAGTGTPWTGILNNGDVNVVYQITGGVANVTADDLLAMIDATPSGALAGSKFYMNRTVFSVIRKLKDLNGDYIFQNPGNGVPGTIWNYPYELSDAFPGQADVEEGDNYILFGNLRMSCVFGDKQQLRVKLLDQATITDTDGQTIINLAEQDMVALRIVERVGYVLALPTALTVLNAAESESPES